MSKKSPHAHGRSEVHQRPELLAAHQRARVEVGGRIRVIRERLAWTQDEAAERSGLHTKYFSRLERGAANPTLATLAAVAHAFDVPLVELFTTEPLS